MVPARLGGVDRLQVRLAEIDDVDVVAHAGAVRRRVVGAEQAELGLRAGAARSAFGIRCVSGECRSPKLEALDGVQRAGDVEVAQAHRGQAVGVRVVRSAPCRSRAWWRRTGWSAAAAAFSRIGCSSLVAVGGRRGREDDLARRRRRAASRAGRACRRRCCASTATVRRSIRRPATWRRSARTRRSSSRRARPSSAVIGSSWNSAPGGTASACPVDRSSTTTTSWPSASNCAATTLPM